MIEGFVHPALAAGAALAVVPLAIHLFNRQRHKPVPWAAMRFVLAAHKRTRRRVEMENWLLLLLRMAAIALLALAIARPFSGTQSPLAGLTETRRDLALVLDLSASAGYREDVESVSDRVVERARELLLELDPARGDRAHLVLAGSRARLASSGDPRQGLSVLEGLSGPYDEALALAPALESVLEFAREEAAGTEESRVEVRLLSDLQRSSLEPDAGESSEALAQVLDDLEGLGLKVLVEDLGPAEASPPNLALTEISSEGPLFGVGAPVDLRVEVANFGATTRAAVRVALEVDGERRPSQVVDVSARSRTEAHFPVVFDSPGEHVVRARLEGDRLEIDDEVLRVLDVPDAVRVLVVNGRPAPEVERDAAGRLLVALQPAEEGGDGAPSPFAPVEALPRDLESGDVDPADYDLVWLCDVDSLTADAVTRLEAAVADGAALVLSLGPRTQPETFNARFFRADGTGLSPAELEREVAVASRRTDYYRVREFDAEHPALALFAEERWRALLTEGPVWQFISARPREDARVLARLDDPQGSPLLLERAYDRGQVYLWTSSFDDSWTALPAWGPFLVPFVFDLVRTAGTPSSPPHLLRPGESLSAEVRTFPRRVELVVPEGARLPLADEPRELTPSRWLLPRIGEELTERVGLYRLLSAEAPLFSFAVQLDPEESDLDRLSPGELESLHPVYAVSAPDEDEATQGDNLPRRGELWRWLALACLAALVSESLWAAWIGRRRRVTR